MPSFCLILDLASESLIGIILKLLDLLICQLNPYLIPAHAWYGPWWVISPDLMFIHESIVLNVQAIILQLQEEFLGFCFVVLIIERATVSKNSAHLRWELLYSNFRVSW